MTKGSRSKLHIVQMGATLLLRMLSGFLVFVVLARLLGVEQFGRFSYWVAISSLLMLVVNFGFNLSLLREIPENRARAGDLLGRALTCKFMLAITAVMGLAFVLWNRQTDWVYTIAVFSIFISELLFSFAETINVASRALGAFGKELRLASKTNLLHAILVIAATYFYSDLTIVALAYAVSRLIYLGLTLRLFLQLWGKPLVLSWSLKEQFNTVRSNIVYATDSALTNIYSRIDSVLLESFAGLQALGLYQAGNKFYQTGIGLSGAIGNVYIPKMAASKGTSRLFRRNCFTFSLLMFMYGVAGAIALAFLAAPVASLVFGSEYDEMLQFLPYFGFVFLLRCMAAAVGGILTVLGHQKFRVIANLFSISVLLVSSWILIPKLAILGLLAALALSNIVVLVLYLFFFTRIIMR